MGWSAAVVAALGADAVVGLTSGTGLAAPAAPAGPFRDVEGHWAAAEVREAVREGLVSGYPDGTFRPQAVVSVGEAIKLLLGAAGLGPSAGPGEIHAPSFQKHPGIERHWSYPWLSSAAAAGVFDLILEDKGFNPDRPATRQEVGNWAARALGYVEIPYEAAQRRLAAFSDAREVDAAVHLQGLAGAVRLGLVRGDGARLRPRSPVTRAEAVAVACRVRALLRAADVQAFRLTVAFEPETDPGDPFTAMPDFRTMQAQMEKFIGDYRVEMVRFRLPDDGRFYRVLAFPLADGMRSRAPFWLEARGFDGRWEEVAGETSQVGALAWIGGIAIDAGYAVDRRRAWEQGRPAGGEGEAVEVPWSIGLVQGVTRLERGAPIG